MLLYKDRLKTFARGLIHTNPKSLWGIDEDYAFMIGNLSTLKRKFFSGVLASSNTPDISTVIYICVMVTSTVLTVVPKLDKGG
jgi:hypothetical protein